MVLDDFECMICEATGHVLTEFSTPDNTPVRVDIYLDGERVYQVDRSSRRFRVRGASTPFGDWQSLA
jgi:hypothetical protein